MQNAKGKMQIFNNRLLKVSDLSSCDDEFAYFVA